MLIPEDSNIIVFNSGSSKGSIASTPVGGQSLPTSTVGDRALWKYVQNIARKNNASDIMNKATPMFIPFWTAKVWSPKYELSVVISLNQNVIVVVNSTKDDKRKKLILTKLCTIRTPVSVKLNKDILENRGQGEGKTKWKGWAWKLLLSIVII